MGARLSAATVASLAKEKKGERTNSISMPRRRGKRESLSFGRAIRAWKGGREARASVAREIRRERDGRTPGKKPLERLGGGEAAC